MPGRTSNQLGLRPGSVCLCVCVMVGAVGKGCQEERGGENEGQQEDNGKHRHAAVKKRGQADGG